MKTELKVAENILEEAFTQIEFLMKNSDKIKQLTNNMVDCKKICDFKTAIHMVYMAGLNKNILAKVTLNHFDIFLQKGLFNEFMLDQKVYLLSVVK